MRLSEDGQQPPLADIFDDSVRIHTLVYSNGTSEQCRTNNIVFMNKRAISATIALILGATCLATISCGQNKLKGYEWLEGNWFWQFAGEYAQIKITRDSYQVFWSRLNEGEKIENQEKHPLDIKVREEYWSENSYLSLSENTHPFVGIDTEKRTLLIPVAEYMMMSLNRIDIDPDDLKEGKAKGIDWLYGIWAWESFDRISMESSLSYVVITPKYYKIGDGEWEEIVEYVIKKEIDSEGKMWYCLADKNDPEDHTGHWKEYCGVFFPEDEQTVYMYGGAAQGWDDECKKLISF